jgi:5-methyltetrahydrofolate--homocysteine methyltransferase
VVVVSSLLDEKQRDDFIDDVADEYEEIREEHFNSLKERRYLGIDAARERGLNYNWTIEPRPVKPSFLGDMV